MFQIKGKRFISIRYFLKMLGCDKIKDLGEVWNALLWHLYQTPFDACSLF